MGGGGVKWGLKSLDNELYYNAMAVWLYFHFQMWCKLPREERLKNRLTSENDSLGRSISERCI